MLKKLSNNFEVSAFLIAVISMAAIIIALMVGMNHLGDLLIGRRMECVIIAGMDGLGASLSLLGASLYIDVIIKKEKLSEKEEEA